MCDPISIIGLGLSVGMAVANYSAQQDMASQQNSANDAWVAYQRRQSQEFSAADEALRKNAEAARTSALGELTPEKQQHAQQNEQARLTKTLTPEELDAIASGKKDALNDKLLSGQQMAAEPVKASIQQQITAAAQEARQRIAALAAVQSYGGSQYGLTNRANTIFNTAGQDIRLSGDERQGRLAAYNVAKAVEPIKIVQNGGGSALGGLAAAGAKIGGGGLGNSMAGMFSGSSV
jgi:hypothetical protein